MFYRITYKLQYSSRYKLQYSSWKEIDANFDSLTEARTFADSMLKEGVNFIEIFECCGQSIITVWKN